MKFRDSTSRFYSRTILLLLFLAFCQTTAAAASKDWQGEWKVNDRNRYASVTIGNVDKVGFEFSYNEGVGINGISVSGKATREDNSTAFIDFIDRNQESCRLKIQLVKTKTSKRLTLSNCRLNTYDAPAEGQIYVPKSQKLYYKAGFNCAKAATKIEIAICDSKLLAASDRKLGVLYKTLRKELSRKNKKRLKTEQRQWLKARDNECNTHGKDDRGYCLRKYYGQRLINLAALKDHKVWLTGNPGYDTFRAIHDAKKQKQDNLSYPAMSKGLGLWLGGVMKKAISDSGSYELQVNEFNSHSYVLEGSYISNPSQGFDPAAAGNAIFIEFETGDSTWVGLVHYGKHYIFIPKTKTISGAPERFKSWMGRISNPTVKRVF